MSVYDNNKFADDDWFIVGMIGDSKTEEDDVNGTVTRGNSLTVTNTLKFSHELDAPVMRIFERGIKIYGAATNGGAGTLITSVDAITTPIADAVMIQWNREYTEYTLISTDTTYAYYYVQFTDGVTSSSASDYVASTGLSSSSVEYLIQKALEMTSTKIGGTEGITREWLVQCADDAQLAITQFVYADQRSGLLRSVDWDFEIENDATKTITTNENQYSLSTLSLKYPNAKSIIEVRIGTTPKLDKITAEEMDDEFEDTANTTITASTIVGQTTLTVASNVEFDDSGSVYLGGEIITYTGKSSTTGFTGIPTSGSGSLTTTHTSGDHVWQDASPDLPEKFTVDNETLVFDCPPESDYSGYPINIRYYKKLTSLTEASDTTSITFTNVIPIFIASRIETRRQNKALSDSYMRDFEASLIKNAQKKDSVLTAKKTYYRYSI